MLKKWIISAIALIFTVNIGFTSVSAYSEVGSIAVSLEKGVEGTSVKDVEFELIKVGDVIDGLYEYTEDFADEKTDLNKVKTSEALEELAIKLDKVADEKKIEGYLNKTDETGYLKFSALEVGIYMLRVTDYAEYEYVEPTIITVPTYNEGSQNSMNFDVVVIPKHTPFKIEISKQDVTTSKELPGAHLSLEDITTGKTVPVEEWISTDVPHMMKTLYANHVYRLTETIAPKGYKIAQSIQFKVEETGKVQEVIMYDELLPKKVKTGDNTDIAMYCCLGGLSFVFIGLAVFKKRKNEN